MAEKFIAEEGDISMKQPKEAENTECFLAF